MKKLILAVLAMSALSSSSWASNDWEQELVDYSQQVQQYSLARLYVNTVGYSSMMLGTCSASVAIVAAAGIADTYPVLGVVAEGLANLSASEYETFDSEAFFSLETLANTGRGTLGGGLVAAGESFEYIFLWLSGREDEGFDALGKVYASTVAAGESLFSEKGKCLMSFSKLAMTLKEVEYRHQMTPDPVYTDDDRLMP